MNQRICEVEKPVPILVFVSQIHYLALTKEQTLSSRPYIHV